MWNKCCIENEHVKHVSKWNRKRLVKHAWKLRIWKEIVLHTCWIGIVEDIFHGEHLMYMYKSALGAVSPQSMDVRKLRKTGSVFCGPNKSFFGTYAYKYGRPQFMELMKRNSLGRFRKLRTSILYVEKQHPVPVHIHTDQLEATGPCWQWVLVRPPPVHTQTGADQAPSSHPGTPLR